MPRIKLADYTDDVIRLYNTGMQIKDIAQSLGISAPGVDKVLRETGTPRRRRLPSIPDAAIRKRHESGESIKSIATDVGIERSAIRSAVIRAGGAPRNRSDAMYARMAQTSPKERKRLTKAAHDAVRGMTHSDESVRKRATKMVGARVGIYEADIIKELAKRGIACSGQKPFWRYNFDIALNKLPVAVEIYSHHPGRKRLASLRERSKYILNSGWSQLNVVVTYPAQRFDLAAVCDEIVSFADLVRRDKPTVGYYRVIRGYGETATTSGLNFDDIPAV